MKHKLSPAEKAEHIERRAQARASKATRRQTLRDWFDARRAAADKRKIEAGAQRTSGGHGVTLAMRNIRRPAPQLLHRGGTYINPARDLKRNARLRTELR